MPATQVVFQQISSFKSAIIGTTSSRVDNDNSRFSKPLRSTHNRKTHVKITDRALAGRHFSTLHYTKQLNSR